MEFKTRKLRLKYAVFYATIVTHTATNGGFSI